MSLEELFEEWERERCKLTFVRDGFFDEDKFLKSKSKILILMKEAPERQGTSNITQEFEEKFNKVGVHHLFLNLARRVYAISSAVEGKTPVSYEEIEGSKVKTGEYPNYLRSSAYINVKKYHGKDNSDEKELLKVAEKDRDFLRQQIDVYIQPKIILTNSTYSMYKKIYNAVGFRKIEGTHFFVHEIDGTERLVKEGMHPQQTEKSDQAVYESLLEQLHHPEVQDWIKENIYGG